MSKNLQDTNWMKRTDISLYSLFLEGIKQIQLLIIHDSLQPPCLAVANSVVHAALEAKLLLFWYVGGRQIGERMDDNFHVTT